MGEEAKILYSVWEQTENEPYQSVVFDLSDLDVESGEEVAIYELKKVGKLKITPEKRVVK